MKITYTLVFLAFLMMPFLIQAQDTAKVSVDTLSKQVNTLNKDLNILKRIKISGYVQPQFQIADSAGQPSFAGGNFAPGVDKRFMIRRGRIKFQYTSPVNAKGISTSLYTLQIDVTEKGVAVKDVFAKITDPWIGYFSVTMGMFDNPFGFEIAYSSSLRETPERGRMSQLHFPNEREVGAMLTVQPPKGSRFSWLKWNAGFFNGIGSPSQGIDISDPDSKKDFITRLSMARTAKGEKSNYGGGISYYDGGFRIDSVSVYKFGIDENCTKGFILDSRAIDNGPVPIDDRQNTTRQYMGVDAQFSINWKAGTTTLRA